jgi:hypothetical protein
MKKALLSISLFSLSLLASGQVLLNQATGMVTGGIASQDFETAYNIYDCAAADDFIVPSGVTWTIDSIRIYGQYSASAQTVSSARLTLYLDSGGMPAAEVGTYTWSTDQDVNADGDLLLVFDCPVKLGPQRYWMSVQSTKTFANGGGQWYWTRDSIGGGLPFFWHNVGGGFGTSCSTFTQMSTCVSTITDPGVAFIMYGCAGGPDITGFPMDTTVCEADSLVLDPGNGNLSNATFNWNTGDSTQQLPITESGFYNVSVTDPNTNCYTTACIDVTVNETPMANIENDTVCQGQTANFNGFANCGLCSYIWDDTIASTFFTTGVHGWHTLDITNPNTGCFSEDSIWLEVESTDPPELAPSLEIDLCEGDTAYISAVNTYSSYLWSNGETTQGIFVSDSGNYSIIVQTPSGCEATDTVMVSVRPAPQPTITLDYTANWKTRLTAPTGYQSYEWSNGETDPITIADSDGEYFVTVTDEFGCEGVVSITVVVIPAGLSEMEKAGIRVFPNPAQDVLTIQWPDTYQGEKQVTMLDVSGRVVAHAESPLNIQEMMLTGLQPGYYTLKLSDAKGEWITTIVKN